VIDLHMYERRTSRKAVLYGGSGSRVAAHDYYALTLGPCPRPRKLTILSSNTSAVSVSGERNWKEDQYGENYRTGDMWIPYRGGFLGYRIRHESTPTPTHTQCISYMYNLTTMSRRLGLGIYEYDNFISTEPISGQPNKPEAR